MAKLFFFSTLLFMFNAYSDVFEVNLMKVKENEIDQNSLPKSIKNQVKKNKLKIKWRTPSQDYGELPPPYEVEAFLMSVKIKYQSLDQLDRDVLYMAIKNWPEDRTIKYFKGKLNKDEVESAYKVYRNED